MNRLAPHRALLATALLPLCAAAPLCAQQHHHNSTTLIVDSNDPNAATPGDNLFAGLQEAIDAAKLLPQITRIQVHSGTYGVAQEVASPRFGVVANVGILVDRPNLTIEPARGSSEVFIRTPPHIPGYFNTPGVAVLIWADDVTVRGLRAVTPVFDEDRIGFAADRFNNVDAPPQNVTLTDNVVLNHGLGFSIQASFTTLTRNVVRNEASRDGVGFRLADTNLFFGDPRLRGTTLRDNDAENLAFGFQITCADCRIIDNRAVGIELRGFSVSVGQRLEISGNRSEDCGEAGFRLVALADCVVCDNRSEHNGAAGFLVGDTRNSLFCDNRLEDNGAAGLDIGGTSNSLFCDNRIKGNAGDGVRLRNERVTLNVFTNNRVRDNGGWGVFFTGPVSDNTFEGMRLRGNVLGESNDPTFQVGGGRGH